MGKNRLCIVTDANDAPCVRSLFKAVAGSGWRVVLQRVITPGHVIAGASCPRLLAESQRNVWRETVLVPGFKRHRRLSEAILRWRRRSVARKLGVPDIVFYTMPRYCRLATSESCKKAYFAYDPYKLYHGWDAQATEDDEMHMLEAVDARFSVSQQICDDWQLTGRKGIYVPNAVDSRFVADCRRDVAMPADLAASDGPIVGCVGQINRTYDWVLIKRMAEALSNTRFVFIGQLTERTPQVTDIARIPNVEFRGWRKSSELAGYVRSFDVCLNPLLVNDMNNRRCPLRLYTYLASGRPIVSTAISEARQLTPLVTVGESHEDCLRLLREALEGKHSYSADARQELAAENTWEHRARALMAQVDSIVFGA